MAGKWHLGKRPEEWPVHRGFDRSFVQIDGAMNYYGGNSTDGPRAPMAEDDQVFVPPHDGFYSTDAFTDHAIQYVDDAVKRPGGKPFFLYLAFNASHWPLQAPEAEIEKYHGTYDAGWQAVRERRLAKMKRLGVVPAGQEMAQMDRGNVRPWNQLTAAEQTEWARRMEVYAAQTEHMDRQIGRLLDELKRVGVRDTTLVVCLSDNGGAAEDPNSGNHSVPIGDRDSFRGYARPWATVSNTPWRLHKTTEYEGGISTALIACWPAGIPAHNGGAFVRQPADVIDLLPTFLHLAGATYPAHGSVKPEGQDITAMLEGNPGATNRLFCWEHEGNRAIRDGNWKLVALASKKTWELYDLAADRVEARDLAAAQPDVVAKLSREYDDWAQRCGVIPFTQIRSRIQANHAAILPAFEDE
jgi:arylsulfatase